MEPGSPALSEWRLHHWTTREVLFLLSGSWRAGLPQAPGSQRGQQKGFDQSSCFPPSPGSPLGRMSRPPLPESCPSIRVQLIFSPFRKNTGTPTAFLSPSLPPASVHRTMLGPCFRVSWGHRRGSKPSLIASSFVQKRQSPGARAGQSQGG